MAATQYKLSIGAKRQVTIPASCMKRLSLEEGGELLLEIVGDHAILLPLVSVPRRELPEELRRKFESRRGEKSSDIPLSEFLTDMGYKPRAEPSLTVEKKKTRPHKARKAPAVSLK
jgi:bifunctional DNA-binding transcriptional regulator/antitoxin component of YhaV-PrlF toxin-antitoxin module